MVQKVKITGIVILSLILLSYLAVMARPSLLYLFIKPDELERRQLETIELLEGCSESCDFAAVADWLSLGHNAGYGKAVMIPTTTWALTHQSQFTKVLAHVPNDRKGSFERLVSFMAGHRPHEFLDAFADISSPEIDRIKTQINESQSPRDAEI